MDNRKYNGKVILFGEYSMIFGSNALLIPYYSVSGEWSTIISRPCESGVESNRNLLKYFDYLRKDDRFKILDLEKMEMELNAGLFFDSNIPTGYGVGSSGALVAAIADILSLALLTPPAEWGADIACGDAQSLGIPMCYGGPYVGYLACTNANVRKLPGRIVGATTDVDGKRAFVLTLQAREQHIRREKANSNICSNQSLMALYVTMYMSVMGHQGMHNACSLSYSGAHYLAEQLVATGKCSMAFDKPFFNEFAVKTSVPACKMLDALVAEGILGGVRIADDMLLVCVTEQRTKEEMDKFVETVKNI